MFFFVSEAKASTRDEAYFEIKGYKHWLVNRKPKGYAPKGGGMLLYVSREVSDRIVTRRFQKTRMGVQLLWIRMTYGDLYLDIVGIYIPPCRGTKGMWRFTNPQRWAALLKCLSPFGKQNNVIVLGDTNFDLFQAIRNTHFPAKEIQGMGYNQLINRATRIESGALLDHIYVRNAAGNHQGIILESGNIRYGISDHDLIYCTVRYENRKNAFPAVGAAAQFVQQRTPQNVIQQVFAATHDRIQGNNNILERSLFLPYYELLAAHMHRLQTARENAYNDATGVRNLGVWRAIRNPFMRYLKTVKYRCARAAWVETGIIYELENLGGFNFWVVKMYVHQNIIQNPGPQPLHNELNQRHEVPLTEQHQNFINDFQRLTIGTP